MSKRVASPEPQDEVLKALKDSTDHLANLLTWVGATAEILATVPRPQGGESRKFVDAIEGGRAWASGWSEASNAVVAARTILRAKTQGKTPIVSSPK